MSRDRSRVVIPSLVLAALQSACTPDGDVPQVEAATRAWVAAFNECSAESLAALYLPEAALWGTVAEELISTPAGIRQYFDRACAAVPPARVALDQEDVRLFGDTALNSGTYTFTRTVDGEARSSQARFSFTYRNVNGEWLIAGHHSSLRPGP